jgi:hypothetical protein
MAKSKARGLREQARTWTCNHFSITDHEGDAVKLADTEWSASSCQTIA